MTEQNTSPVTDPGIAADPDYQAYLDWKAAQAEQADQPAQSVVPSVAATPAPPPPPTEPSTPESSTYQDDAGIGAEAEHANIQGVTRKDGNLVLEVYLPRTGQRILYTLTNGEVQEP